jgi:predicted nuclease of predicted toxin-antitoxin system
MKFLLDANLPRSAANVLRDLGHEVEDVRDVLPGGADDAAVVARAKAGHWILVTRDFDFADIRNYPPPDYTGIVVLELPDDAIAAQVNQVLKSFARADRNCWRDWPGGWRLWRLGASGSGPLDNCQPRRITSPTPANGSWISATASCACPIPRACRRCDGMGARTARPRVPSVTFNTRAGHPRSSRSENAHCQKSILPPTSPTRLAPDYFRCNAAPCENVLRRG